MPVWFALIVAPVLALADQAVAFALVGWSCAHGSAAALHAVHAVFLAIVLAAAASAVRARRAPVPESPERRRETGVQLRFLAPVAAAVAGLSALAIAAMWIPTWLIASCIA